MKGLTRVVILSNQTLLVEGVIARLQQYRDRVELIVVDIRQPDLLSHIARIQPAAIILDDNDMDISQAIPLDRLLQALPTLKVLCLDTQRLQTQVIRCEQYWVTEVRDLLDLVEPSSPDPSQQPFMIEK